jgi:hypothetical protein
MSSSDAAPPSPDTRININTDSNDVSKLSLSFKDVEYSVKVKEGKKMVDKTILKQVSGLFQAGCLTVSRAVSVFMVF